ncbi:MAG: carbohydrate ABC transporter substrate-binding protein [Anaerolineales bacterium]|nr:carbohydrate ABC transporter substrate-binding protein [Anaerolineales bacterium]
MKKRNILLVFLLVFGLFLVACGSQDAEEATTDEAPASEEATTSEDSAAEEAAAEEPAELEPVTITYLTDDGPDTALQTEALVNAFMAKYPHITIVVETRPGGSDGDNIVKTRLATGEMTDVFSYNSGSLFQALHPTETLVDLTNEPFMDNIADSFFPTVSADGKIYGVPTGTATGGGILYNMKVYEELGLSVPQTWAEFEANNEVIQEAGITPVIATFGDSWTSQLFVLADYYNVETAVPGFADAYTNNESKYATTPAALNGFKYLQEGFEKDWYQQDYATTTFEQGLGLLAEGQGAHYPMLTFAVGVLQAMFPDNVNDIGFFGVPGENAETSGATIWIAPGTYIPQTSEHVEEAKLFLGFIASAEGADVISSAVPPTGPYLIKGVTLPDTVLPSVKDTAAYIDAGKSYPALEFVSPIKGPALEQICVAVGSGQMTAEEGAAAYDQDVEKQAQQLGLPGW